MPPCHPALRTTARQYRSGSFHLRARTTNFPSYFVYLLSYGNVGDMKDMDQFGSATGLQRARQLRIVGQKHGNLDIVLRYLVLGITRNGTVNDESFIENNRRI